MVYYGMLAGLPLWASYLLVSMLLAYMAALAGVIIGKAGYSPFWGFVALSPPGAILLLAFVAWGKWRQRPLTPR